MNTFAKTTAHKVTYLGVPAKVAVFHLDSKPMGDRIVLTSIEGSGMTNAKRINGDGRKGAKPYFERRISGEGHLSEDDALSVLHASEAASA